MGLRKVGHGLVTAKATTTTCRFLGCRIDHLIPTSPLLLPFQHVPARASLCLRGLRPREHPCSNDSWELVDKYPSSLPTQDGLISQFVFCAFSQGPPSASRPVRQYTSVA